MTPTDRTPPLRVVGVLVAVSGFCSLVYQVVWERTVRGTFGGDSISSAIVTGTFLLGLGIGAVAFGRWHRRAFALFAVVELAIGLYAIASYHVLAPLGRVLGAAFGGSAWDAAAVRPSLVVACILFLLPPCVLIGATTPLMFNCFIRPGRYASGAVGRLYALNTAGAALGVVAVPFVFLNRLTLPATLSIVGAANLLLGAGIWLAGRGLVLRAEAEPLEEPPPEGGDAAWLGLAFLSGLVSLGFEVSLFRAFFTLNPSSPYNFPSVLIPFLLAIALGSALLTRFRAYSHDRALRRVGLLFVTAMLALLLGVVLTAGLSFLGFQRVVRPYGKLPLLITYGAILAGPLPFFLGGVLPLLFRLASPTGQALPAKTGLLALANAIGAFAGALLVQFVGFPYLGTRGVLITLLLAGVAAGAWCLMKTGSGQRQVLGYGVLAPAMALVALLVPAPVWDVYTFGVSGPGIEQVEGMSGVALIRWQPDGGRVFVNGQYMSALPDDVRHVQLVSFALALPRRERVLVLGLGGGGMVRELVRDPGVRRVDVVDWSHELPPLLDSPRARALLADALRDPKVRLCRCDARVVVSLSEAAAYEVIIDNLAEASWVGATGVKSEAYFRQLHRLLAPSGVLVYKANYAGAREAILAGLASTFRVVREHERGVVLASEAPAAIAPERVEEVLAWRGPVIGAAGPPYADWMLRGLKPVSREQLGNIAPMRDDLLIYEYTVDPLRALLGSPARRPATSRSN
jgi:spermidine synthase